MLSKKALSIALVGSRGIPACYSGFETFYEELGARLVEKGHKVTCYNRSHFQNVASEAVRGVRIVSLPSIATKHLDTITHTTLSTLHALFANYDIVYFCIVGNSPLVWIPRMRGAKTLLNVDGEDWAREKWGWFAGRYQKWCERIARRTANTVIADAHVIQERYARDLNTQTVFVPYGANIRRTESSRGLERWGLTSREYILYVGRLVPENGVHRLLRAFRQIETDKRLVIVGDAPFSSAYKKQLRDLADDRTLFTGYAFGGDYEVLSSHAYVYVQPSEIEGTRPALLDQLGFGNCVLVSANKANREVIGQCGISFDIENAESSLCESLRALVNSPQDVADARARARQRIESYYNWDWISDFYEDLFMRVIDHRPAVSYDEFIQVGDPVQSTAVEMR
jgi:glycosyltransferase involved in cell wall biosynthesis